jgi:acyl-homoserine-lactone acylase
MTTETNRRVWPHALLIAALAVAVSAATLTAPALAGSTNVSRAGLRATIRTTEYGIPHVLARDYPGLGFGTGYAAARDNLCTLASSMVVTSAQSSRYFGPEQRPRSLLTRAASNLSSDLYFAGVNGSGAIERLLDRTPPRGPRGEVREMVRGFAAGFNEYLAEGHQSSCTGAEWLRPMTELDVYRFLYALGQVFGQGAVAEAVVAAQPPTGRTESDAGPVVAASASRVPPGPASNGLALGGEATASGRGMVLANPHFFWQGDLKFWQVQQTIPDELNVSGAAFLGVPFVAVGHTRSLAWSGTATDAATHFTLVELALVPGSPTSYLVDGTRERMTRREITVEVRRPDGTVGTETRSQWRTRYGPVVSSLSGMALPWTTETAYALADPNTANLRLGDALFALNHARRTRDVVDAATIQGLPWFNLTAADAWGRAVFVGPQVVPHVTDAHAARCNTALGRRTFLNGLPVLDGSRSDCAPRNSSEAAQTGIFGPDTTPTLHRDDY